MEQFMKINTAVNGFVWGPVMLVLLVGTGVYLSIAVGFIQFTKIGYWWKNTIGKIFKKGEAGDGEITPLQAVSTALASTVGTGNIAGVTGAIILGGPGAVFWMWVSALFGMVTKFSEVTLAVKYRERNEKGDWCGGPMYYIKNGLGQKWSWLAVLFCSFAILASFGIGNMSQANSINGSIKGAVTAFAPNFAEVTAIDWVIGIALALLTAGVLFGGIKRIGSVTEKLIPFMSILYILFTLIVIFGNIDMIGECFRKIFVGAFNPQAVAGAGSGILLKNAVIWGLRRSAFSNEAGLGSAPIAHAAANCEGPVQQGIFGIFEVFVDTILICSLTALSIIISGVDVTFGEKPGSELITSAFSTIFGTKASALFVAFALMMFAYSTILGWSLYGTRCVQYLFGMKAVRPYQIFFCIIIVVGCVSPIDAVWDIADTFNGLMAIPNFIALFALSPVVFKLTKEHFAEVDRLKARDHAA